MTEMISATILLFNYGSAGQLTDFYVGVKTS
jgi:hypothetical protein